LNLKRATLNIEDQKTTTPFPQRGAVWWYLLCSAGIFGLIANGSDGGGCTPGGIVYCYGDSRDYWWHPTKVIGSFVFAISIPVPHILFALFFRSKRNLAAVFSIARSWHKAVGVLLVILITLGFLSALITR
jgi:hypothetical protein